MTRAEEIRELLKLTPEEVIARAGEKLIVCDDVDALHQRMAQDIAEEIAANPDGLRLIVPVGPTGQYPLLAQMIAAQKLSLKNVWLFFMDEYDKGNGHAVDETHPLSFRRVSKELFFDTLPDDCGLNLDQVIFPDETNVDTLSDTIKQAGGIDTCYGGIGIHGHIAFNEPEAGVSELGSRRVRLNDFTVTINAIRSRIGGNLENYPRHAFTLGMTDILGARRIRLYCRNGIALDWANTVLRLALFGMPDDDYPVTHIRDYDYTIITDKDTLQSPEHVL